MAFRSPCSQQNEVMTTTKAKGLDSQVIILSKEN